MNDMTLGEDKGELEEELAGARAEVEALQATVADREARALHLEAELASAREELSAVRQDVETRDEELGALRARSETLEAAVRDSAGRYLALALERAPELPPELIAGESVDEIDDSIERARATVAKVRGHLETQAQSARVPVGAPSRSEPDLSGLSASEKIARGIEERRSA